MTPALTAKQSVLAATALCGELSPLALARLIPSQSYRYHVAEELAQAKLLRTYRKDRVKGYRLTRRAKELLAGQQPERYAALFTGSVRTNSYPSELSRRLRMHRLGETLTMMQLCGVRILRMSAPPYSPVAAWSPMPCQPSTRRARYRRWAMLPSRSKTPAWPACC